MNKKAERDDKPAMIKVRCDADLERDLEQARERTGIRTVSELVRYALRQVAQGNAA